jgi:hypothetical protein
MSSTRLDIIRAVRAAEYAIPQFGRRSRIDPDLDQEAGMDGNYQRMLQAARNLDAAAPLPNPEEAKALIQQVVNILPYAVAVLEGAKKEETARALRECEVQLRAAVRLLTVSG